MLKGGGGPPYDAEPTDDEWDAELIRDAAEFAADTDILAIPWVVAHKANRYPWESATAWQWLADNGYDVVGLMAAITAQTGPITPH